MTLTTTDDVRHDLHRDLVSLGVCAPDSLEPFHSRTRDRDDVGALRCRRSGVIMLSRLDHLGEDYYEEKRHEELAALGDRERVVASLQEDTARRERHWRPLVANRRWTDVGTGAGALLDALGPVARRVGAVEPQPEFNAALRARGYEVHRSMAEIPEASQDVITLFHVFEHLFDPLGDLRVLRERLVPGGRIVIEVPHARDLLLDFLDVEAFRSFTIWSEHLLLHTRESLRRFLEAAGFTDVTITGLQRYPVANHLHWLATGLPGGHQIWSMLRDESLDTSYEQLLARLDMTDTLVAEARVPAA